MGDVPHGLVLGPDGQSDVHEIHYGLDEQPLQFLDLAQIRNIVAFEVVLSFAVVVEEALDVIPVSLVRKEDFRQLGCTGVCPGDHNYAVVIPPAPEPQESQARHQSKGEDQHERHITENEDERAVQTLAVVDGHKKDGHEKRREPRLGHGEQLRDEGIASVEQVETMVQRLNVPGHEENHGP